MIKFFFFFFLFLNEMNNLKLILYLGNKLFIGIGKGIYSFTIHKSFHNLKRPKHLKKIETITKKHGLYAKDILHECQ